MAAKTMAETVALIGQEVRTVAKTVEKIDAKVETIEKNQASLDTHIKAIMGPPSLEDKLTAKMDDKDTHKHNNVMQAITNTQAILSSQQEIVKLQLEAKINEGASQTAAVAKALESVAEAVRDTELARKENHASQLAWQNEKDKEREADRKEDAEWKRGFEKKVYIFSGALIGIEAVTVFLLKIYDAFKH